MSYSSLPARVPPEYPCKNWGSRRGANDPIISYPIPLYLLEYPCKNWGSKQGAYTNDPIISYPILRYLPEYPCKNWGPRQGVCTYELILNVPDKITVVPSMHTSLKLQLRRATLHYWPAGALECIVQPVLHVTDKSTVVPSTHTSLKLQLRRATLHYWPAGRRPLSSSCGEQPCTTGRPAHSNA